MTEEKIVSELPWPIIQQNAELYKLNPNLVAAVIMVESSGDEWAVRMEPLWHYFYETKKFAQLNRITEGTEKVLQACSWGLMQVMGSVAREHHFSGPLQRLCEPEIGIRYGCKHLAKFMIKYKNERDAIASYNAGSPVHDMNGKYKNNDYVVKVLGFLELINKARG